MAYQQQQQHPTAAPTPSLHAATASMPPPAGPQQHLDRQPVIESPFTGTDLRSMKTACEFSFREYMTLQKRRQDPTGAGNERICVQAGIVVSDLTALRSEVSARLKMAEAQRWRKWLLGGMM
jgi:hypothetical protein